MKKESWGYFIVALPVIVVASAAMALALPPALGVPLTALSAVVQLMRQRWSGLAPRTASREHIEFTRQVIDVIPQPVYVKDADSRYIIANRAFCEERGLPLEEIVGRTTRQIARDTKDCVVSRDEDLAVLAGKIVRKEMHDKHPTHGGDRHRFIMKAACHTAGGESVIVGSNFDLSAWWLTEQLLEKELRVERVQYHETLAFLQRVLDLIPHPVYVRDMAGHCLIANRAMAQENGISTGQLIGSTTPDAELDAEMTEAFSAAPDGSAVLREVQSTDPRSGHERFLIISKGRCLDVNGAKVTVCTHVDLTELRQAERELKRLAEEDTLTGIANRRHFNMAAQRAIEQAHRHGENLSLLMFDLDHFKHINDKYGHGVGDEVLREMVRRMRECFRNSDLPARWGGEEFITLLPQTTAAAALQVAERLRARLATKPVATSAGSIEVTLSGGGAQLRPGESFESLVARADAALYCAKNGGRNRIEVSPELGDAVDGRDI